MKPLAGGDRCQGRTCKRVDLTESIFRWRITKGGSNLGVACTVYMSKYNSNDLESPRPGKCSARLEGHDVRVDADAILINNLYQTLNNHNNNHLAGPLTTPAQILNQFIKKSIHTVPSTSSLSNNPQHPAPNPTITITTTPPVDHVSPTSANQHQIDTDSTVRGAWRQPSLSSPV